MPMNANTDVKVTPKNISSMKEKDVDSKQHSEAGSNLHPIFKDFTWYQGGRKTSEEFLIQDVRDAAGGLEMVLGLIEMDDLNAVSDEPPLFGPRERGQLMRFAIATARLMSAVCDRDIEMSNDLYLERQPQAGAAQ